MTEKNIFLLLTCFVIFSTLPLISCGEGENCSETLPDDTGFSFRLVGNNQENLIGSWGATYNSDKVFFTQEDGTLVNLTIPENGHISFIIPDYPSKLTNEEQTKIFYLKLPDLQGNPNRDIDTLKFEYLFNAYDCPSIWYDYFKVYYNDSLYHNAGYIDYFDFLKK